MREISQNLDLTSQAQMFQIVAREAIEALEKDLTALNQHQARLASMCESLEDRVKVLEEARKIQIKFNQKQAEDNDTFVKLMDDLREAKKPKSFWPW